MYKITKIAVVELSEDEPQELELEVGESSAPRKNMPCKDQPPPLLQTHTLICHSLCGISESPQVVPPLTLKPLFIFFMPVLAYYCVDPCGTFASKSLLKDQHIAASPLRARLNA